MSNDPRDDSKNRDGQAPDGLHGLATTRSAGMGCHPFLLWLATLIVMPTLIAGWVLISNGCNLYDVVLSLGFGVAVLRHGRSS